LLVFDPSQRSFECPPAFADVPRFAAALLSLLTDRLLTGIGRARARLGLTGHFEASMKKAQGSLHQTLKGFVVCEKHPER
jgi:hypothetical protein